MTSQELTAISIAIGASGTVIAIVREVFARIKKGKDDVAAKAAEEGKTSTLFALIQQSVSNLEKGQIGVTCKVEGLEKTVNDHETRITVLEQKN
jgi:hypothetical protein